MQKTEEQVLNWVEGCKKTDRKSQECLYKYFYPLMMPVCMTYVENNDDAVDIFNRAFLKIFSSLDLYKYQGPFGAWVRRIVVNTAIDFLRQNKRISLQTSIDEAFDVHLDSHILEDMTSAEILSMIRLLPENHRTVLNLYVFEDMTHAEIGEQLGISSGTSKWHLNQARKLLKEKINQLGIVCK
ncbi:MAG: sigma-70 family RNA polymerase sigma factor [Bacteroidetes bacterium]|nr:sigma-70 family RNA polymerase sigma factor [Bacteroidota bacterium]